ncbi:MAG TPA: alcohol dehydrogenase catalytic domain-containing protein [Myxococcales bacterium]|nr:alcohol dehydrogenase catalytic domain-containing protein [Myxococcales bacterium]
MRAIVFDKAGDPGAVLRLGEAPEPVLQPNGVVIEVRARVIQPADFLFMRGVYRVRPVFPQVAGFDGAGVVLELGREVRGLSVGQRVAFRSVGAWAERAVAPAERVYAVPDDIADEVACQFPLNPLTAWGLLDVCSLSSGVRVLATAGRSVTAALLAALARRRGIQLVRVARRDRGYAVVGEEEPGRTPASLSELLGALAAEKPFDAGLDAVGGPNTLALIGAIARGGQLVSYGVLDDAPFPIRASTVLYRNLTWRGFGIDRYLRELPAGALAEATPVLWDVLRRDPACAPVSARYPLSEFRTAIGVAQQAGGGGKVILTGS